MLNGHALRYDDTPACPVALFVHRIIGKALRNVFRQIARQLVTQALFLERVAHMDIAIVESNDALPDRAKHAVILPTRHGDVQMPGTTYLLFGHGHILERTERTEATPEGVEIAPEPVIEFKF
jgi:hypothetical protein